MLQKVILIFFGVFIALILSAGVYAMVRPSEKGIVFKDVNDFRQSVLDSGEINLTSNTNWKDSVSFASIISPHPSDEIIYELKPNLDVKFTGVRVRTNSCGMRGPERTFEKPKDTIRIALLGDSFAFGWGVDQDKTFGQVLEDNLNRISQGKPHFEVLNLGVPGYSTFQEVALFREKALDFNPDAILIFFVHNDFEYPFFIKGESAPGGVLDGLSLLRSSQSGVLPKQAEMKLISKGLDPNSSLVKLSQLAKEKAIKVFLTINPRRDWESLHARLKVLQSRSDIEYIDIAESFERDVDLHSYEESVLNLPNDHHPTALRHRIYGDSMTPYFISYIPET